MLFWTTVKVALRALLGNKLRSILAMLGIIIGVMAVIAMLALGAGAQKSITDKISAMGSNLVTIRPAQKGSGGVMSGTQQNLTVEDAQALLELPYVKAVAPVVQGNVQVKYKDKNSSTQAQATSNTYLDIRNFVVESGVNFTDAQIDTQARVALLGPQTATDLFGDEDPVDKTIKVSTNQSKKNIINFKVIGVLKAKGDSGFFNMDDQIIIPYSTGMKELFGLNYVREIDVQTSDNDHVSTVSDELTSTLRNRHKLKASDADDVQIRNQADQMEAANATVSTFTFLLAGIASISLLVGGIGIMNIMLVTVTERTREIGVRKAIGARESDILKQFLIEAILISGLGGLAGVGIGVGIAMVVNHYFPTVIQPLSIVLSLGFSAAVGIIFGYYPARRPALLDPIEALRYE